MECITGIRKIAHGKIEINGIDATHLAPEKRKVGYVPQDCLLFPHLTVDQNIGFGLGNKTRETMNRVRQIMEWLSISNFMGRRIDGLSGGEKQKIALARALVMRPSILLLDEPFSTVDRFSRTRLLRDLRKNLDEVHHTLHLTSIYVTHDLGDAQVLGDKVAIMNGGHIEQVGSWERILQTPNSTFVADFMGFNILHGHVISVEDDFAIVEIGRQRIRAMPVSVTPGNDVVVFVRPQAISLSLEKEIRKPGWRPCKCNVLEGSITEIHKMGSVAQIQVDTGFPLNLEVSSDILDELNLVIGKRIFAQFRASEVSILDTML